MSEDAVKAARRTSTAAGVLACFVMGLALAPQLVLAADADRAAAIAQLHGEQRAAEAAYTAREAECKRRFVVSACIADAKRDRRTALDALRDRQLVVDETARRERAGARRAEIAAKASEDLRRDAAHAAKAASAASSPQSAADVDSASLAAEPAAASASGSHAAHPHAKPAPPLIRRPASAAGAASRAASPSASRGSRAEREQAKRESFDERRDAAARHRDEVARRNSLHPATAKPPLPAPSQALLPIPKPAAPAAVPR